MLSNLEKKDQIKSVQTRGNLHKHLCKTNWRERSFNTRINKESYTDINDSVDKL